MKPLLSPYRHDAGRTASRGISPPSLFDPEPPDQHDLLRKPRSMRDGPIRAEPVLFAGERSATADHAALARAKELLRTGRSGEAIRQDTGWFIGPHGKWVYEIDDSQSSLLTTKEGDHRADNFLHHPELFKAYPALKNRKVTLQNVDHGGDSTASFDLFNGSIEIQANNERQIKAAALHELQHGIQSYDGRVDIERLPGGVTIDNSYDEFEQKKMRNIPSDLAERWRKNKSFFNDEYLRKPSETETFNVENRMDLTPAQRREIPPIDTSWPLWSNKPRREVLKPRPFWDR